MSAPNLALPFGESLVRRIWYGIRIHWVEGPVIAAAVLVILLLVYNSYLPVFTSFQFLLISNGSAALALAAIGETLVVLSGGFDLSVGAVMALVNVILATQLNGHVGHDLLLVVAMLGAGLVAGLINGFFVAFMRLQSIIVTIATLFIFNGLALLVLPEPGGAAPTSFVNFLTGTVGTIPRSFFLVLLAAGLWLVLKRSKLGKAIYAVGSDPGAAYVSGVPVRAVLLATYTISGFFYAVAAVYLTGQTASGDPRIGTSFLLTAFVAVVLGGTRFGGGYGSAIGSIIGGFIVTVIVGVLFVVGVNSFYTSIVEGIVLILAVLLGAIAQRLRPKRASSAMMTTAKAGA